MSFLESLRKMLKCKITKVNHDCYDDDDEKKFEKGKRKNKKNKKDFG